MRVVYLRPFIWLSRSQITPAHPFILVLYTCLDPFNPGSVCIQAPKYLRCRKIRTPLSQPTFLAFHPCGKDAGLFGDTDNCAALAGALAIALGSISG